MNLDYSSGVFSNLRHRCPVCRKSIRYLGDLGFYCDWCNSSFSIVDGIPQMLVSRSCGEWWSFFEDKGLDGTDGAETNGYYSSGLQTLLRSSFQRLLSVLPDESLILDLGCGNGGFSKELSIRHKVVGVDFAPSMLSLAHKNGLIPYFADATVLPFEDDQFDAVVCAGVIQNFDDPYPLLAEMMRTCRPGGLSIFSTLDANSILRRAFRLAKKLLPIKDRAFKPPIARTGWQMFEITRELPSRSRTLYWVLYPFPFVRKVKKQTKMMEMLASDMIICLQKAA